MKEWVLFKSNSQTQQNDIISNVVTYRSRHTEVCLTFGCVKLHYTNEHTNMLYNKLYNMLCVRPCGEV